MRSTESAIASSFFILAALLFTLVISGSGCGRVLPAALPTPNGATLPLLTGVNVMKLTVNGSLCAPTSYANKPCVSVTVCAPGTSQCREINDILLDTGSFGLRIFGTTLAGIPLTPVTNAGRTVTECARFGGGTSDWGPVETADVILGGEAAVRVPIQVINSRYAGMSQYCAGADVDPSHGGFNGILGVGLFRHDCGDTCANSSANQVYFSCATDASGANGSCSPTALALGSQVQNPAALLPQDGNGVIIELPSVPSGGKPSIDGYVVLGIGTRDNNHPGSERAYTADAQTGEFTSTLGGKSYPSFIDTGSNGFFFQPPAQAGVPSCATSTGFATWFCPSSPVVLTAVNTAASGAGSGEVPFQIGNATDLLQSGNAVFVELGGGGSSGSFDWGLPFYIGRNVYVGFESGNSAQGHGPYWAY